MTAQLNNGKRMRIEDLADRLSDIYTILYYGKYEPTPEGRLRLGGAVERGDKILRTEKDLVKKLVEYRHDFVSSDRETIALALAFETLQEGKEIKHLFNLNK